METAPFRVARTPVSNRISPRPDAQAASDGGFVVLAHYV